MVDIPEALAEAAALVVSKTKKIDAVLVHTLSGKNCNWLLDHLRERDVKVIVASHTPRCISNIRGKNVKFVQVQHWHRGQLTRISQVIGKCLENNYLASGERVLCLMGDGFPDSTDVIKVWQVTGEERVFNWGETVSSVVNLAIELASSEVEEKPVGAAFIVGDWERVLQYSHPLLVDPLASYKANVKDRKSWEIIKKITANFDGAFVVKEDGEIVASCRRLDASRKVSIPQGLGTRHHAVAAMTSATKAKGITVSQEDRMIRIFKEGKIVARLDPKGTIVEYLGDGL